jgi:hypothetical protein
MLFCIIVLLCIYSNSAFIISPNKQAGIGLPCSNRAWASIKNKILPYYYEQSWYANYHQTNPLPIFNDTLYLAGVYYRSLSDQMLWRLTNPLTSLVLKECIDYLGEYIQAIEDQLNNIVSVKSWSSVAHDTNFDYYYGRAYWVELYSSKHYSYFSKI